MKNQRISKFHGLDPRRCKGIKGIVATEVSGLSGNRPRGLREIKQHSAWKGREEGRDGMKMNASLHDKVINLTLTSPGSLSLRSIVFFTVSNFTRACLSSFFTKYALLNGRLIVVGVISGCGCVFILCVDLCIRPFMSCQELRFFGDSSFLYCFR